MEILEILKFASESFTNFLITFTLLSVIVWGLANMRLVTVDIIPRDLIQQFEKEEDE